MVDTSLYAAFLVAALALILASVAWWMWPLNESQMRDRAAALALRRLDAPGALYLRRALRDHDAFARDMAQQVLDLPHLQVAG
jgi:hypothetical protein